MGLYNRYAIRFLELPEHLLCSRCREFELEVPLLNGRTTPALMLALPTMEGLKPVELIVSNDLDDKDIQDLETLEWRIIQQGEEDTLLPPIVAVIPHDGCHFVACNTVGLHFNRPFYVQTTDSSFQLERFAPWPDAEMYRMLTNVVDRGTKGYGGIQFYTFNEFFELEDMKVVPIKDRTVEYARFIRRSRTAIDAFIDTGQEVEILNSNQEQMPEVMVEKRILNDSPPGEERYAVVRIMGYAPNLTPTTDCLSLSILEKADIVAHFLFWPNPYLGKEATSQAIDMVMSTAKRFGSKNIMQGFEVVPFTESCGGELGLPDLNYLSSINVKRN